MTIYAKQVPPELQESPLMLDFYELTDCDIFGNRNYNKHVSPTFERLRNALEYYEGGLQEAWDDLQDGHGYNSWIDALNDLVPPEGRGPYTRAERLEWYDLIQDAGYNFDNTDVLHRVFCRALELITGHVWAWTTLRGSCQGEWQYCIYRADLWRPETLQAIEMEYFNTGTEWMVSTDYTDEIRVYCYGWSAEKIADEIRAVFGGSAADTVELDWFDGYTQTPKYRRETI